MYLSITDRALERIEGIVETEQKYLLLFYDTEGCGCGVNGTPTLRQQERKEESHMSVECPQMKVIVHQQQATFFEEEMKLDIVNQMFRLSSSQGILNPFISPAVLQSDHA